MTATGTTWTIARNDKTTYYEVHADGCKHLIARHMEIMSTGLTGTSREVAAEFERGNDYCLAKLGPCAK